MSPGRIPHLHMHAHALKAQLHPQDQTLHVAEASCRGRAGDACRAACSSVRSTATLELVHQPCLWRPAPRTGLGLAGVERVLQPLTVDGAAAAALQADRQHELTAHRQARGAVVGRAALPLQQEGRGRQLERRDRTQALHSLGCGMLPPPAPSERWQGPRSVRRPRRTPGATGAPPPGICCLGAVRAQGWRRQARRSCRRCWRRERCRHPPRSRPLARGSAAGWRRAASR